MHPQTDEFCGLQDVRQDWIDDLIVNLKRRIRLEALYIFGSRATGEHLTWSDYDLCVVSPDFESIPMWRRMEQVLECWNGKRALEPVCVTVEELEQSTYQLFEEIRRRGRRLYPLQQ